MASFLVQGYFASSMSAIGLTKNTFKKSDVWSYSQSLENVSGPEIFTASTYTTNEKRVLHKIVHGCHNLSLL